MTKQLYGIIGHPVGHSLSPAMQNAAFRALDMDAEYRLFDIEPGDLENFLDGAAKELSGFNITIPHKIKAMEYIAGHGSLDDTARRLGAVNTVKVSAGRLSGYNTDGPGFYRSLVEDLKFEPEGRRVFVLGAGGAATAVVMYLGSGPGKISIWDIDSVKTEALKRHYESLFKGHGLEIVDSGGIEAAIRSSDLFINATPVGMHEADPSPIDKKFLRAGMYVYDLVYNRSTTQLAKDAQRARAHAATGLGMLLYQGAIAFEIWAGRKAPVEAMKKALKAAI